MRIIPRAEWGARAPKGRTTVTASRRRTFVVHYDDSRPTTRTGPAAVKATQNYHMDSNKWSDIGYNFLIDQKGAIFEGRGWDTLGAHAGPTGNVEGIGVQIHIGGAQAPSPEALASLVWLKSQGDSRFGRTLTWKRHADYMSTACPGKPLTDWLAAGRPGAGATTAGKYVRPVALQYAVTAVFRKPGDWAAKEHTGIDFGCPIGTPVYAVAEGDVRDRPGQYGPDYGLTVVINEDDGPTRGAGSDWSYSHLSRITVRTGQRVTAGQLIGYSGNSGRSFGPHLHLERRPRMGRYGTHLEPVLWNEPKPGAATAPAETRAIDNTQTAQEDPVPAATETRTTLQHPGGQWLLPEGDATAVPPKTRRQRGIVTARIAAPDGVEFLTRWVSWDNKAKDWVRYAPVAHTGKSETSFAFAQGGPEADLRLDVYVAGPVEFGIHQTALIWEV